MPLQIHGSPIWTSRLLERIRQRGPARCSVAQWMKFIAATCEHGVSQDEIACSRICDCLLKRDQRKSVSREEVVACASFAMWLPRLELAVDDRYCPSDAWVETA